VGAPLKPKSPKSGLNGAPTFVAGEASFHAKINE
jgi:hypothetical protein